MAQPGVGRSSAGQSSIRGKAVLTPVCGMRIQNGLYYPLGLGAVDGSFVSYMGIQDAYEDLWRAWLRIGRGTGDSSVVWSGVCRTLTGARRSYSSSFDPDSGLQLDLTLPKLVKGRFSEVRGCRFSEVRVIALGYPR